MKCLETFCIVFIILCFSSICLQKDVHAAVNQAIIDDIEAQLEKASSPEERSRLYMFRARNYAKGGNYDKILESYDHAIRLNHRGWIHLERARFFLANKKYALAEEEATAAKEETSTLQSQADSIIRKTQRELEKIYLAEHPPEIIFDTRADTTRKSRFDYMRKRDFSQAVQKYSKKLDKERTAASKSSKSSSRKRVRRS